MKLPVFSKSSMRDMFQQQQQQQRSPSNYNESAPARPGTTTTTKTSVFFNKPKTTRRQGSSVTFQLSNVFSDPFAWSKDASTKSSSGASIQMDATSCAGSVFDPEVEHAELQALYTDELRTKFETIREQEYARLDIQKCMYFDYTGGMIAPQSLLVQHHLDMVSTVLGNPHSEHSPSKEATICELAARKRVLEFCGADPDEYAVVWTPNASGALKLVGESYPFNKNSKYIYAPDCHNSLLGISKYAEGKKGVAKGFDFLPNSLCYDWDHFESQILKLGKGSEACPKLLGIPAESNVSGYVHNTKRYTDYAHSQGWDVCVDGAALAPSKKIRMVDLGFPEFMCMSFYKIFGYPTGVGCLLAKKSAMSRLKRPWFAGGTVRLVGQSANTTTEFMIDGHLPAKFEDGTINYTSFQAVTNGLNYVEAVGLDDLNIHIKYFASVIETRLRAMRWKNGKPLVYIPDRISDDEERGNVIAANFLTPSGSLMPHKIVEKMLVKRGIAARTGCFCNPGSGWQLLFLHFSNTQNTTMEAMMDKYLPQVKKNKTVDKIIEENHHQGTIRISVGLATNMADVDTLMKCIQEDFLDKARDVELASRIYRRFGPVPYSKC